MIQEVSNRLKKSQTTTQSKPNNLLDAISRIGFYAGTGQFLPEDKNDSLADRLAIEQYKIDQQRNDPYRQMQMKNIESQIANRGGTEPEGFEKEDDVPQNMAGLPIKQVTFGKGGRIKPTYGYQTPLVGGFDMQGMLNSYGGGNQQPPQQAPQPSYDVQPNDELETILRDADYANMSDEEQEDFLGFLESKLGGQNG